MKKTNPKKQPREITFTAEEQVIGRHIERQFSVMTRLTELMVKDAVRALIISGAPGIGKSYSLEKRLDLAIAEDEIGQFTFLKGRISAIALFKQLWDHKEPGDVLVLDDIDGIFHDEVSLNLLKAALDTGDRRVLHWLTANEWLAANGVDNEFEFNGTIAFLTNLDFDRLIERGSILAPHLKALLSRSTYLSLGIHTNKEILIRIKQVIQNTEILAKHHITYEQKWAMIDWLDTHYENLRDLSIRTILKLAAYMKGDPDGWQDIALATMVRNSTFIIANLEAEIAAEEQSRIAAAAASKENDGGESNVIQLTKATA
jgi:hypothetical protein